MKRIKIGEVGVDSGQLMIVDPCYIESHWKEEDFDDEKKSKELFSYNAVCKETLGKTCYGQIGNGLAVAFSSGYGDGCYPVYAEINEEGRVMKITVDFNEEE